MLMEGEGAHLTGLEKHRFLFVEIELVFKGQARVHWTETHTTSNGKTTTTHTRHYSDKEHYFTHTTTLWGPGMSMSFVLLRIRGVA